MEKIRQFFDPDISSLDFHRVARDASLQNAFFGFQQRGDGGRALGYDSRKDARASRTDNFLAVTKVPISTRTAPKGYQPTNNRHQKEHRK